jgi:Terminase large subunit, T4likevirus-type, N-terminal
MLTTRVPIRLPRPHPNQKRIEDHPAKRKVIPAGRRGGKTTLAARLAVRKFFAGRRILLASTTQDQADAFWFKVKLWLQPAIDEGHLYKNETKRIISFNEEAEKYFQEEQDKALERLKRGTDPEAAAHAVRVAAQRYAAGAGFGRIKVKTAYNADTLRGDYADFLVLDECAKLAEDAWKTVGAPMLLDNDGDAWFIGTPRRKNWFYKLFLKDPDLLNFDRAKRWKSFTFSSLDNPYLSAAALAEITEDMTADDYKQEILAAFLDGEGQVFRNITPSLNAPTNATPAEHEGHALYIGGDWAKIQDYTAWSVGCATCRCEVELVRLRREPWKTQRGKLIALIRKWKVKIALLEQNSVGDVNIEELINAGQPVLPFYTTNQSKGQAVRALVLSFENVAFQFLPDATAKAELEAFEQHYSMLTGFTTYSAPEGLHDDTVIARMLLLRAAYGATMVHSIIDAAGGVQAASVGDMAALLRELQANA